MELTESFYSTFRKYCKVIIKCVRENGVEKNIGIKGMGLNYAYIYSESSNIFSRRGMPSLSQPLSE
jgi:hypothetical protein